MGERCRFDIAWAGRCRNEATADDLCARHAAMRCWCGAQAVRDCGMASSLVCGEPLCAEHGCRTHEGKPR